MGLLFTLFGCSATKQITTSDLPPKVAERVVLFVGGYKGTALRDAATKQRVWITAKEELFGKRNIALNPEQFGEPATVTLEPEEALDAVRVLPPLWVVDVYNVWFDAIRRSVAADTEVITFGFDWRQDNFTTAAELAAAIRELHNRGAKKIVLFVHSMGALPVSYFLRYGSQAPEGAIETWEGAAQVAAVAYFGPPFLGSAYVFRNMQLGAINQYNPELMNRFAVSTFPAAIQLIPPLSEPMLRSPDGTSVQDLVYDPAVWERNGWGLFYNQSMQPAHLDARREFLKKNLKRNSMLYQLLWSPPQIAPAYPVPVFLTRGTDRDSLTHFIWDGDQSGAGKPQPPVVVDGRTVQSPSGLILNEAGLAASGLAVPPSTFYERGDGVVDDRGAQLPPAFQQLGPVTETSTKQVHDKLMSDSAVEAAFKAWITPIL